MTFRLSSLAMICTLLLAGSSAVAQPRIGGGGGGGGGTSDTVIQFTTPETTKKVLEAAGFQDVQLDSRGHVGATRDGLPFLFWHFSKDGKAPFVQFIVNFGPDQKIDQNWVNAWNRTNPFAKYIIAKDGYLMCVSIYILAGGVTPQNYSLAATIFAEAVKRSLSFKADQ